MTNLDSTQTEQLLQRASDGDRQAADALIAAHRRYLRVLIDLRVEDALRVRVDPKETMTELFGVDAEVLPISKDLGGWVVHPRAIGIRSRHGTRLDSDRHSRIAFVPSQIASNTGLRGDNGRTSETEIPRPSGSDCVSGIRSEHPFAE